MNVGRSFRKIQDRDVDSNHIAMVEKTSKKKSHFQENLEHAHKVYFLYPYQNQVQ